jgi:hypothetical protein
LHVLDLQRAVLVLMPDLAVALDREPLPVLLGHQVDSEAARRILRKRLDPLGLKRSGNLRLEL